MVLSGVSPSNSTLSADTITINPTTPHTNLEHMKSVQESKNELEAAIRYAENSISSAKQTIESMEFRQEMAKKQHVEQAGREEALQREVAELHKIRNEMQERIDELMLREEERNTDMALMTDEIQGLKAEVQRQQGLGQGYYDTMMTFKAEVEKLRKEKEASSGPCGCQAYRDLEEKVGDLKDDLKDQREFDNEVRDAVKEFIEQLGTIGFEGA